MKLEVRISCAGSQKPKTRSVELVREAGRLLLTLDGRPVEADAVEVATGTYSILLSGQSFEVRVQPAADGVRVHTGGAEFSARVLDPRPGAVSAAACSKPKAANRSPRRCPARWCGYW